MTKPSTKKITKRSTDKVDFEPNKMTFAIAAFAVVSLTLLAVIVMTS